MKIWKKLEIDYLKNSRRGKLNPNFKNKGYSKYG